MNCPTCYLALFCITKRLHPHICQCRFCKTNFFVAIIGKRVRHIPTPTPCTEMRSESKWLCNPCAEHIRTRSQGGPNEP